jgi:hypothetical protein
MGLGDATIRSKKATSASLKLALILSVFLAARGFKAGFFARRLGRIAGSTESMLCILNQLILSVLARMLAAQASTATIIALTQSWIVITTFSAGYGLSGYRATRRHP